MRPVLRDLVGVLEQEKDIVAELVEILQQDQQRVIRHDVSGLEASSLVKEEIVLRFQSCEQQRQHFTQQLGAELRIPAEQVRVSTLCPLLGPEGEQLEQSANSLRALVTSLGELVAVSRGFLEQSILGIRGLLALIQTLRAPGPGTYDAAGRHEAGTHGPPMSVRREA